MHTIELFAEAIRKDWIDLPCEPVMETCALTGDESPCIPRKKLVSSCFTNQMLFRTLTSQWVSVDAFQALKYRPERSSWFINRVDSTEPGSTVFRPLKRPDIRNIMLNYSSIKGLWALYASTTGQKHGVLYAGVNPSESGTASIAMDGNVIYCKDYEQFRAWYYRLDNLLRLGVGRKSLESLSTSSFVMRKIGYRRWHDFRLWAADKYRSLLYRFLIYLLPSQAELKAEAPAATEEEVIEEIEEKASEPLTEAGSQLGFFD